MTVKFRASNPMLLDYLRYISKTTDDGPIRLSSTNDFGKMSIGLYKLSSEPINIQEDELTVELVLPRHQTTAQCQYRYVYFTESDMKRLNYILNAIFNLDLDTYYLQGIQAGMPKIDIIDGFIISRRLASSESDLAETLSKRTYRSTLGQIKSRRELLLRKARYHQQQIEPPFAK